MTKKKVAVGMSGGVDSSVAAAILKEQGYELTGIFIEAYNEPGCRTDQDKKDALQAAIKLGIPFQTLDVRKEYKEKVVKYFYETYKKGATPNPDVVCNREVKFGLFYEWARADGFEMIATGHYARIYQGQFIQRAVDLSKDQSYFLWQVPEKHLARILFPLGEITKKEVRAKAKGLGLANAEKPDSMGICMMGELNVREFLKEKLGEKSGEVVMGGRVIGQHKGLWFHTVGQRGGFEVDKKILKKLGYHPEEMEPLYVIDKDIKMNGLIVGKREEACRDRFMIQGSRFMRDESEIQNLVLQGKLFVRIRNLGELNQVSRFRIQDSGFAIETKEPIFGVAEGQAAVIYARTVSEGDELVVAGGEISV